MVCRSHTTPYCGAMKAATCRGCWQTVLTSGQAQGSADALEQQRGLTHAPTPPRLCPVYQCQWPRDVQASPSLQPALVARLNVGGVSPSLCLGVRAGCRRG